MKLVPLGTDVRICHIKYIRQNEPVISDTKPWCEECRKTAHSSNAIALMNGLIATRLSYDIGEPSLEPCFTCGKNLTDE